MGLVVYLIFYLTSFLFARAEFYYLSGISLLLAALYLYLYDYRRSHNVLHLRGLFSLFWVGGEGLACLKLSRLQTDWSMMTWICFALALVGFWVVFEVLTQLFGSGNVGYGRFKSFSGNPKPVFRMITILSVLSIAAFVFEAFALGYVPLFVRGVPHAYSEFHITGVHYFTVACVLIPALAVLYFHMARGRGSERQGVIVMVLCGISLLIPILCVSRYQFVFAVVLALFTYISLQNHFQPLFLVGAVCLMIPVYLILTVARSHDVTYLNSIFEMKNSGMPIFISQPYMYVANNYDNFNCMVEVLPEYALGFKGLYPLWALTGLKFLFPQLAYYPIYVDKKELTTLTMFYDAYYDFGIMGVLLFSCLLGLVAYLLVVKLREMRNPMGHLLYAQIAVYFTLSFFTTWFSNPTTWFYLIITGAMAVYYSMNAHRR